MTRMLVEWVYTSLIEREMWNYNIKTLLLFLKDTIVRMKSYLAVKKKIHE